MALITNTLGIVFVRASSAPDGESSSISGWLKEQRLAQVLSMVTETVNQGGGIVVKSLDDSVLATFPAANSALKAAVAMQKGTALGDDEDAHSSTSGAGRATVDLGIALHFGKLVVAAGNISGDVVEEAALLSAHTEAGQILATGAFGGALRGESKSVLAGLSPRPTTLGSRSLDTYDIPWQPRDDAAQEPAPAAAPAAPPPAVAAPPAPAAPPPPPPVAEAPPAPAGTASPRPEAATHDEPAAEPAVAEPARAATTLQLTYDGSETTVQETGPGLTLGRSPDNALVVKSPHVSRKHAVIEFTDGAFYLVNKSANGSCVKPDGRDEVRCNDRHVLTGSGIFGLGPDLARCGEHRIAYKLL